MPFHRDQGARRTTLRMGLGLFLAGSALGCEQRETPSELRVLDLIGDGLSNREIADRLGVAEKTIKNHITSLLAKMGLQRRTQVAAWVAARKHSGWRAEPGH